MPRAKGSDTTEYLRALRGKLETGLAGEDTHRPALAWFLEGAFSVTAVNEPKHIACGAPDLVVRKGEATLGWIEAKDIGANLEEWEASEQLGRYRDNLRNLMLTDYLEFRWYVDGKLRSQARLARVTPAGKLIPEPPDDALQLLADFMAQEPERVASSKALAVRMARLTHMIRDTVIEAFERDDASQTLTDLRQAFADVLIPDLDQPQKTREFADMFAQTLAYGLFAARCNHRAPGPFERLGAAKDIPKTNPLLRNLFDTITGPDLDEEPYASFVNDLVQLLALAQMEEIWKDFGKREERRDPVVHFYETFLREYDPRERELRGVYYTPWPVVSYIVRSVDYVLKERFGLADGVGDAATVTYERQVADGPDVRKESITVPKVLILDPACGTGTFLYAVVDQVRESFTRANNAGLWSDFVRQHLLPRIFGFELLMAPHAVAHLKLGMQLAGKDLDTEALQQRWAYDFQGSERLSIYLTNTLEEAERVIAAIPGPWRVIAEEAREAAKVKREMPIMVVLGNPPYSGHSANKGKWIDGLLKGKLPEGTPVPSYYEVDGQPLGEKNPKWLQDDYVKFIRWAQWRIERTGAGILGFITNHGYLDNPTFRGMRQQMMRAFTDIYVLNLHGNAKKRERCPDGSKDENVFDIQQGVAILIAVKHPNGDRAAARVLHADLWGLRQAKEDALMEQDVASTEWTELTPRSPSYLFVPYDADLEVEYEAGWKVTDIFPVNGVGMTTARDRFVTDFEERPLLQRVTRFRDSDASDAELCRELGIPRKKGWDVTRARQLVRKESDLRQYAKPVLYRPYDVRLIFYHDSLVWRTVRKVMQHILAGNNLGLVVGRSGAVTGDEEWNIVGVTAWILDFNYYRRGGGQLHPLYLHPARAALGARGEAPKPRPNLSPRFIAALSERVGLTFRTEGPGDLRSSFGPEDVFHCIYAVLHSPTYRRRYAEFLRRDFPRIPLTSSKNLFRALCAFGADLVALHLLEPAYRAASWTRERRPAPFARLITSYPVPGSDVVQKGHPKYHPPGEPEPGTGRPLQKGRVYINKEQYFAGVPKAVWAFHIGGYQVCEKWLKDRAPRKGQPGRKLSLEDKEHYPKIVVALKETIRLMQEIDAAIPEWPIK